MIASRINGTAQVSGILPTFSAKDKERKHRIRESAESLARHCNPTSSSDSPAQDIRPTTQVELSHLLISPLLPPITTFLAPFSGYKMLTASTVGYEHLSSHPTLIIWGTEDGFTSHKRLQRWTETLRDQATSSSSSLITAHAVSSVSHFWTEPGALTTLTQHIQDWTHHFMSNDTQG